METGEETLVGERGRRVKNQSHPLERRLGGIMGREGGKHHWRVPLYAQTLLISRKKKRLRQHFIRVNEKKK